MGGEGADGRWRDTVQIESRRRYGERRHNGDRKRKKIKKCHVNQCTVTGPVDTGGPSPRGNDERLHYALEITRTFSRTAEPAADLNIFSLRSHRCPASTAGCSVQVQ